MKKQKGAVQTRNTYKQCGGTDTIRKQNVNQKTNHCDSCYNVYSEKLYTSKLERLDLRNTQEENTRWLKQEYHSYQQIMSTENSIVRKIIDKTIQEKQNG